MSITKTNRMGLTIESDDELIDQQAVNWPILDSYASGIMTAAGTTPPDSFLYDGCIVTESANGKSWLAYKNPLTGAYSKQWLQYPWSCATYGTFTVGSGTPAGFTSYGLSQVDGWRCVNSSLADIVGGMIIPPIAGIYQAQLKTRWVFGDQDPWYKSAAIMLNNNSGTYNWNCDIRRGNDNMVTNVTAQVFTCSGKDTTAYPVGILLAQNSADPRDVEVDFTVTLISPL